MPSPSKQPLEALVDPVDKDSGDNTPNKDQPEQKKTEAEEKVAKAKKELKDEAELVSLRSDSSEEGG